MSADQAMDRISVRVERQLKHDAESILDSLGLNLSDAIKVFLRRLVSDRGIPFPVVQSRAQVIGAQAAGMEAGFAESVRVATAGQQAAGLPLSRFDPETRRPYLLHPDGSVEFGLGE